MRDNKKFFLGIFVGIVVMVFLIAGLFELALESRTVRMLLFDTVKEMSTISSDEEAERTDTTSGAAIDWSKVSEKEEAI